MDQFDSKTETSREEVPAREYRTPVLQRVGDLDDVRGHGHHGSDHHGGHHE